MLSDTVGFISNLPHNLVASFQSTLEEASNSDLLVQIVDVSDPHYRDMLTTTSKTLRQIGAEQIPMVTIFNKADKAKLSYPERSGEDLIASALDKKSLEAFIDLLNKKLFADLKKVELLIPFDQGSVLSELIQNNQVLHQEYNDKGTKIVLELSEAKIKQYQRFVNI